MNHGAWIGNLTADPEMRTTATGKENCTFRLAVERGFKDQQGNRITDFLPFISWGATAAFIYRYFKKGNRIGVTGALYSRNYEDNEGKKRTIYEINVDHAYFCEKASSSNGGGSYNNAHDDVPPPEAPPEPMQGAGDEMPF